MSLLDYSRDCGSSLELSEVQKFVSSLASTMSDIRLLIASHQHMYAQGHHNTFCNMIRNINHLVKHRS